MSETAEPKPQECWGLYDASGKLREMFLNSPTARYRETKARHYPGWTIRPGVFIPTMTEAELTKGLTEMGLLTVTPSDKNGGEG